MCCERKKKVNYHIPNWKTRCRRWSSTKSNIVWSRNSKWRTNKNWRRRIRCSCKKQMISKTISSKTWHSLRSTRTNMRLSSLHKNRGWNNRYPKVKSNCRISMVKLALLPLIYRINLRLRKNYALKSPSTLKIIKLHNQSWNKTWISRLNSLIGRMTTTSKKYLFSNHRFNLSTQNRRDSRTKSAFSTISRPLKTEIY